MTRPSDWSPVDMDRDPTPGEPDEVRELADELRDFADDVGDALGRIRGMAGERAMLDWAGLSADAFRREFDGVPGNLTKLEESYSLCSQALQTYWPKLQTAQGMADRALDRAVAAQADLASAQSALGDATDWVGRAGEESERLQREGERDDVEPPDEADVRAATRDQQAAEAAAGAAQGRVNDAEERLSAARQLALDAQGMREDAARECARDIEEASDAGIQNRKWWQDAIKWVTDNWDTLVEICKVIVAVLGIVVMIIGGPLAWVVLAAALVVLADTLIKYARGEAGLLDVAFAALDCIPGFKGLTTLGGLARGLRGLATTGLRGLQQGLRGLGQTLRRMGRGGDNLVCRTDPIDMATGEMVMDATDVTLPGVLPLVLQRHHRTSLREGTWFGRSWASTLDQRLVLDPAGVRFVTADGMTLDYPRPLPDEPVLPVEGPRWGLAWSGAPGDPLTVHQPATGRTLAFAPISGRRGGELPLVSVTDRHGNRIDVRYDAEGAPTDVVHDAGYHVGVTTHQGRITELRLLSAPDQPVLLAYGYDERGDLTEITNSSGRPFRLSYDDQHRVTGWRDRNDRWYRYTYDTEGRCVATDGTDGALASRIVYDAEHNRTLFTDALGGTTVFQFNDCYQLVTETDPLGHHTHRAHDRYDRLLSLTDPLGRVTRYRHDERGRVAAVVRPDGREVRFDHDELGLPIRIVEADEAVWQQEFDERGSRLSVTDPAGVTTRYAYDDRGGVRAITDPFGNVTSVECDAAGQVVAVTGPAAGVTRYRRDAFGRPVEVTEPGGGTRRLEWSVEGKPLRHTDPLGGTQVWHWDGEGNCLRHIDEAGGETRFAYGPFDLPTVQVRPDGARYTFTRDAELRLVRVTNPQGLEWSYTFDAAGGLVGEVDFDGRATRYRRDAAGQLVERVNAAGQRVAFERDAMGLISRKDADGQETRYTFDAAGRLLWAANPDAELELVRDPLGRIVAETCNGRTVTHTFDALARPVRRTTPGGVTSEWRYDAAGKPVSLTTAGRTMSFEHDVAGREVSRGFGADVSVRHAWDAAGHLVGRGVAVGGRRLRDRTYAYRADHYLSETHLSETPLGESHLGDTPFDAGRPGEATRLTLDPVGRVLDLTSPAGDESYRYDDAGNQVFAQWPDAADAPDVTDALGDRQYTGTSITRAGRVSYRHDALGRIVSKRRKTLSGQARTWSYAWDAEGRLTSTHTPDGARWAYAYDPLGRRIAKHLLDADGRPVDSVLFAWDGATLIEQSTAAPPGAGRPARTTTWEYRGTHPVAQLDQDEVDARFHAIVTDLVGAPTELLDESGAVTWRRRATLWGTPAAAFAATSGGADTPLRFPGQYADEETGWHYNYHRHYDPETARYTAPDPMGLSAAPNPVAYVHNPHIWSDPLGLEGFLDFFTVQSPEDAARLRGDGTPWPGDATRGQYGDGVYSWGSQHDAEAYADLLRNRRGADVEIMHFRVSEADFASMNRMDITALSSDDAEAFMDRHSRLYGDGAPHNFDYIRGFTSNFGNEHFFTPSVFCRLKFS
ncbi:DUF6531 domain-containing protein [Streptomyces sp. DSM 44915]|uniref:DUF6531 domain-containing protein n=1 Tax=Streptomyces chisholmiae TaxID=3075540 RepID=A0ABU2JV39_9ACTN|nr:DUF6531 domain-containing protein [Streptomyces sp. DSM 44915]MDT0268762.1 DUF6531 domain-containing protein [Streptomyces sp. DSM 44915]